MTNIETLLVQALNSSSAFQGLKKAGMSKIEAFMDIPAKRPTRFVTVERTGGGETDFVDSAQLAIQFWAESRVTASNGAYALARILEQLPITQPLLGGVDVQRIYNFPDTDQNRYQLFVVAASVRGQ